MLVRLANREDPDQIASLEAAKKQSDMGLHCLSRPLWQATSVPNFITSTFDVLAHLGTIKKLKELL